MSCDDVRSMLIDAVVSQRRVTDAAVLAHIDSCPACRAARIDYERLWREMGDLGTADPSPVAGLRFRRRLAAERLASPRPAFRRTLVASIGAIAAAALVAGPIGYQVGTHHGGEPKNFAELPQRTFLLLLHEDSTFRPHHPAYATGASTGEPHMTDKALETEYLSWAEKLPGAAYVTSNKLVLNSAVWFGPPTTPPALGDQIDGFFVIQSKDMAAAEQIAATCPHLKHGGRVELREIGRT